MLTSVSMSGTASPLGASAKSPAKTVQIVKKRREAQAVKGSSDEDEEWFAEQDRGAASGSATDTARSPGNDESPGGPVSGGGASSKRYKRYWSQLLGCHIQAERKKRKPKILVMCDLFGMYLKETTEHNKEERLQMMKIVTLLMRKGGLVKSRAPIAESVRQRVAEERRLFRFGEDRTDIIQAQKKKNAALLQAVRVELDVTKDFIRGIDERDRKRRKREQLKEAAAKMGMTLEEFEAARAKTRPPKENDKTGQKSPLRKAGSPLRGGQPPASHIPLMGAELSPLRTTESPDNFARVPKAVQGGEDGEIESPLQRVQTDSAKDPAGLVRDDSFKTSMKAHMHEKKFNQEVKSLELVRKATVKVLAVLGRADSEGDVVLTDKDNTAEEDAQQRMILVAHQEKVSHGIPLSVCVRARGVFWRRLKLARTSACKQFVTASFVRRAGRFRERFSKPCSLTRPSWREFGRESLPSRRTHTFSSTLTRCRSTTRSVISVEAAQERRRRVPVLLSERAYCPPTQSRHLLYQTRCAIEAL